MSEIAQSHWGDGIALILTILFTLAATLNLAAPNFLRRLYRRWDYPRGFYYVVGVAEGLTALFLAVPETRIWGGILGAFVLFATTVSLLNHRQYVYAIPAILMMIAIAPAMA
jgi:DoxX-like family